MIAPGSTIGIIGGGQLGRMLGVAAAQLGYRTHVYAPEASGPATEVAAAWTRAAYDDGDALRRFAGAVDVVTYEFENVPVGPLRVIEAIVPVRPSPRSLEVAGDRLAEKAFVVAQGGRPAAHAAVASEAELRDVVRALGLPARLKTRWFCYDGKGQVRIGADTELAVVWAAMAGQPGMLEPLVTFDS